jgi:hypothetical protein
MWNLLKSKLGLLVRTQIGFALLCALAVVAGGSTIALAATGGDLGKIGTAITGDAAQGNQDAAQGQPTSAAPKEASKTGTSGETTGNKATGDEATRTPAAEGGGATASTPEATTVDIHGYVGSVNASANTFTLPGDAGTRTITVNAQTQFKGGVTGLSGIKQGTWVEVACAQQADGSFVATAVETASSSPAPTEQPQPTATPEASQTPTSK